MTTDFRSQWTKERQDVPFDHEGNQQHYPEPRYERVGVDMHYVRWAQIWKPNDVFEDTLTYDKYSRGRSAAYFSFMRTSTGTSVTVFLRELEGMVPHMVNGRVVGKFTFCKRGQNYGCKWVSA